jgi:hypothetical protein
MKLQWLNSPIRWKDSFIVAFAILATIETFFAISGISLDCIWGKYKWFVKLLFVIVLFLIMVIVTFTIKYHIAKKGISIIIRGIKVNIKQGDIFKANGWKVIGFNEYFDTAVDDIVIAHGTVNGKFIDNYVENLDDLNNAIVAETDDNTEYKRNNRNGRNVFPLGRIIRYGDDYMLLAFSHFTNNQSHLTTKDYEHCLRVMWKEISRTYANRPVFIPLLGSGITRFEERQHTDSDLLKCILCTLRTSNSDIKQPITILLTEETIQNINIYEIKGVK